jgi:predicted RNA-binding protein YlqC (UPF0109 family)
MKELVEFVAKHLVSKPDQVEVEETQKGNTIVFQLRVAEEDRGRIIGKNGSIAKALRSLVSAAATKNNQRATVEIVG